MPMTGAPGTVVAVIVTVPDATGPVPTALTAWTEKVKGAPGVRLRNVERVVGATVVDQAVLPLPADLSTR